MNRTPYLLLLICISFFLGGCVAAAQHENLGSMRESRDITNKYRSLTIDSKYNYYYSGVELNPDVIMGIDKSYRVQSKFWHPVDLTEKQLDNWVMWGDRLNTDEGFARRYLGKYVGAFILGPDGAVVGDWYSKKDWGIFEFPGNNVIIPHPPRNRSENPRSMR